jgi:hypothetical protein
MIKKVKYNKYRNIKIIKSEELNKLRKQNTIKTITDENESKKENKILKNEEKVDE